MVEDGTMISVENIFGIGALGLTSLLPVEPIWRAMHQIHTFIDGHTLSLLFPPTLTPSHNLPYVFIAFVYCQNPWDLIVNMAQTAQSHPMLLKLEEW